MRRRGSLPWKKALLESRWAGRGPGKKSREPRTLRFEPLEVRMLLSVTITANKPNATLQPLANGEFTVTESVAPSSSETINFQLSGTATYGTDFTVQVPSGSYNSNNHTGTVVVTHTQTTATIDIVPVNNAQRQNSVSVVATIESSGCCGGGGYTIGSPNSGTVTVPAGIPAAASITATQPNASEVGPVAGQFQVAITPTSFAGTDRTLHGQRLRRGRDRLPVSGRDCDGGSQCRQRQYCRHPVGRLVQRLAQRHRHAVAWRLLWWIGVHGRFAQRGDREHCGLHDADGIDYRHSAERLRGRPGGRAIAVGPQPGPNRGLDRVLRGLWIGDPGSRLSKLDRLCFGLGGDQQCEHSRDSAGRRFQRLAQRHGHAQQRLRRIYLPIR